MSRGLGGLQREILKHLGDPIREGSVSNALQHYDDETVVYGMALTLGPGVHDLRHVSRVVARERDVRRFDKNKFQAAFSRAVRSLVCRGILEVLWLVPLDGSGVHFCWDRARRGKVERLSDGEYLRWQSRQARFVRTLKSARSLPCR